MMQTLNIPIKLLRRYRSDKQEWELFAFAVCIKCLKGHSGIHPDTMQVRRMMQCGHHKAERMIERAKHCSELFYYNEKKNYLVARSFTHGKLDRVHNRSRRKEYIAYQAECYKFRYEASESISHIEISRLLRDKLIIRAIKAKERKNDFIIVAKNHTSSRSDRAKALSTQKLARIAGVHHTTVCRRIRKMEAANIVKATRHPFIKVVDYLSGESLTDNPSLLCRKPFLRHGYLVVKDANEYRINAVCADVFTNVIFNHEKRHRHNYSKAEIAFAQFA